MTGLLERATSGVGLRSGILRFPKIHTIYFIKNLMREDTNDLFTCPRKVHVTTSEEFGVNRSEHVPW